MDDQTPKTNKPRLQMTALELDFVKAEESQPARPGGLCPHCQQGILDYDGMLVLRCPICGFAEGGCFT